MSLGKILFVDDEPDIEILIMQKFRRNISKGEYQLIFASSGIEALEKVQNNTDLDLILTDINMPEMDGLTLLAKLNELNPVFQTIVISAYGDMNNIRMAMNAGAFDFLTKPINLQDLEFTIQKGLQYVQKIKEAQQRLYKMQAQLVQNEKMSALGQLIAGVAHEINNLLNFIAGNLKCTEGYIQELLKHLQLYQRHYPHASPEIENHAEEIDLEFLSEDLLQIIASMKMGTDRISKISISLRTFSRSDTKSKEAFNIHEGIDSTLLILGHRLKANEKRPAIKIIQEYGNLPLIDCYPSQLNQVFMNILANAIDALDEANQKRTFAEIKTNPNLIKICTELQEDNTSVIVSIKDNGPGMLEETKQQVFDYLFTTKAVDKGTGLGLAISRQIVEDKHGGKLRCISELGVGTEFVIELTVCAIAIL